MTLDHFLAVLALLALAAFLGTLDGFVREIDLIFFVVVGVVLAGYDFWRELRGRSNHGEGPKA